MVVYIVDINNYQIYYANLLPVDLKQILDNSKKSKAKVPTKTITIKPIVESSQSSLRNICLNFIYNSKSQMGIPIKNIEELRNVNLIEFKVVAEKGQVFDYILNNDVYPYATLNDDLKSKVALTKGNAVMIQKEIKETIKIKDRVYYNSYLWSKTKNSELITIGKAFIFNLKEKELNLKFKGTLSDRIKDMQFYIDLMLNKSMSINDEEYKFPTNSDFIIALEQIKVWQQKLENLKELESKLKEFNINFEKDIEQLKEQDRNNLFLFMDIFCKNKISKSIESTRTGLNCIKIDKYNIAVWCVQGNEQLKFYNFFSDLKDIVKIVIVEEGEEPNIENITSPYLMLEENDIIKYSNFNAKVVEKSFETIKNIEKQSGYINKFILNLLQAYDKDNSRNDLLELAKTLCNKISLYQDEITNKLNKLQIIRRSRKLTKQEKNSLIEIRQNLLQNEMINFNQCGIAILLENEFDFKYFYNKMSKEEQKEFDSFPISNLIKNR